MSQDFIDEKEKDGIKRLVEEQTIKPEDGSASLKVFQPKDLIGATIGDNYQIEALIGEGGMSAVYKAQHKILKTTVAIKLIHNQLLNDKKSILRFQQEAKAAVDLHHQNICGVKEFGVDNSGRPYLVMEYVEGYSLQKILQENHKLSVEKSLRIVKQICEGLSFAHQNGVIHRDIKPANIVISDEKTPEVKIVDFGIAKLIREDESGPDLTKTGDVFGTPNYMSPEQCMGEKVSTASDIYSIGCVLYEMLSGSAPFASESYLGTLMKQVNDQADKISGIPDNVMQIVRRCLDKVPSKRYSDASELKEDIEAILTGNEISQKTLSMSKPSARNIDFLAYALLVVVMIGTLSIFSFLRLQAGLRDHSPAVSQSIQISPGKGYMLTTWGKLHKKANQAIMSGEKDSAQLAFTYLKKAVESAQMKNPAKNELAYLYWEYGGASKLADKKIEGIRAYDKASQLAREIGNYQIYRQLKLESANLELSLAKEQLQLENKNPALKNKSNLSFSKAISKFREVLNSAQSRRKFDNAYIMLLWNELGKAYLANNQQTRAADSFKRVLKIEENHSGDLFNHQFAIAHWKLGLIYEAQNKLEIAQKHLKRAIEIARLTNLPEEKKKSIKDSLAKVESRIQTPSP